MMRTFILSATAAALLLAATPGAEAAGCIKGALLGGVAGHVAGHGILGAAGGCVVGRHMANKKAAQQQQYNQGNQSGYSNNNGNNYQNSNSNQNGNGYTPNGYRSFSNGQ